MFTILNYFMVGWQVELDAYYMHSFEIWLAVTVVFTGAGNLGYSLLEYRLGQRGLKDSLAENVKWLPFLYVQLYIIALLIVAHVVVSFFFFGGLSIHLSKALLAHLVSYDIQWGATKKEVERSNFFEEIPKILQRFRVAFILCFLCVGLMIGLSLAPQDWRIASDWSVIFPLALCCVCHVLYPIVLNPWLMVFSY
jgi:hypothetical protein